MVKVDEYLPVNVDQNLIKDEQILDKGEIQIGSS